jgi:molybdate transport system ATP-binding protein
MTLRVAVRHRLGAFALDAAFASDGPLTALFGRSGAGKTTLVNVVGGLIRPDWAEVAIGGETLVDTERGIAKPAYRRRLGYVFQEGRLFPHLTVRQNLNYGRWFAPREERTADFDRVVEMLGIGGLLDRRPGRLSGGEKQRVAIGRALLASPRLLLMDEPLASLDEARKAEILPYIERLRDEARVPIVYVSHSVAEVARLATTVVLLSDGKVVAAGPVSEVMARVDLFPLTGRAEAGAVLETRVGAHDAATGLSHLQSAAGEIRVPLIDSPVGSHVRLRVRARDVILAVAPPQGISALNILPGTVSAVGAEEGPLAIVGLDCGGAMLVARVTKKSVQDLGLAPGRRVYAIVKSVAFERRAIGRFNEPPSSDDSADT